MPETNLTKREHYIIDQLLALQAMNVTMWLAEVAGRKPHDCPREVRNAGFDLDKTVARATVKYPDEPKVTITQKTRDIARQCIGGGSLL